MDLTISNTLAGIPTPTPPNMDRIVRLASSKMIAVGLGHEIEKCDAPTPEQREGLERRRSRLAQWLAPTSNDQAIRDEVGVVLGTMAIRGSSETDASIMLSVYVKDLRDLPLFAIAAACKDFRQGRVGDKQWAPTQAQIREVAERYIDPVAKEKTAIGRVLDAKVIETSRSTPEHRKQVVEKVRESLKQMAQAGLDAEHRRAGNGYRAPVPPPPETLDELKARMHALPAPVLGESLIKTMPNYRRPDAYSSEAAE